MKDDVSCEVNLGCEAIVGDTGQEGGVVSDMK